MRTPEELSEISWGQLNPILPADVSKAMEDENTTDIFINDNGAVFAKGFYPKRRLADIDYQTASRIVRLAANACDKNVSPDSPDFSGYIKAIHARVEGSMPPRVQNPEVTFRMLNKKTIALADYVKSKILTKKNYDTLVEVIESRANAVIVGNTGSGKTTLMGALIQEIAERTPNDRIVLVEDTRELNVPSLDRSCSLADITELDEQVKRTLRKTPDRIMVGEVRGVEILQMFNLWRTGHNGGLGTFHSGVSPWKLRRANSMLAVDDVNDAFDRIESMISPAVNEINDIVRRQITKVVDVIINIKRYSDGELRQIHGKDVDFNKLSVGDHIKVNGIYDILGYNSGKGLYEFNQL